MRSQGVLIACYLLTFGVFDSKAATPGWTPTNAFPVGNESFFRSENAKVVRFVSWYFGYYDTNGNPHDLLGMLAYGLNGTIPINTNSEYSPSQLVNFAKTRIAAHFAGQTVTQGQFKVNLDLPTVFAEHHTERYEVTIKWYSDNTEIATSYGASITIFSYTASFFLEQGTNGTWAPPAWVLENAALGFTYNLFLRVDGIKTARIRWWDGTRFYDISPFQGTSRKKTFIVYPGPYGIDVDADAGEVMLPSKPVLQKMPGVLTLGFTGATNRFALSTGTQVPAGPDGKEPLAIAIRPTPEYGGGVGIFVSGDTTSIENIRTDLTLESSTDFHAWQIVTNNWYVDDGGWLVSANNGNASFRARYK